MHMQQYCLSENMRMHKLSRKAVLLLRNVYRQVNKILNGELVNITQGSNVIIAPFRPT